MNNSVINECLESKVRTVFIRTNRAVTLVTL